MRTHKQKLQKRMNIAITSITIITALVGIILVIATSYFATEELEQTSMSILRQNVNQIDTMLETLDRLNVDFVTNTGYLWQFMNSQQAPYDEYKAKLQFDRFYDTVLKLYPQGVSLYINADEMEKVYLNGYLFTHPGFDNPDWLDGAFISAANNSWQGSRQMHMYTAYNRYIDSQVIYVMRSYPIGSEKAKGMIGLYVDTRLLNEIMLSSLPSDDSQMYIISPSNEMITGIGENSGEYFDSVLQSAGNSSFMTSPLIYSLKSEYTGWTYSIRIPRSSGFALSNSLGTILIVCVLIYCVLISSIWTILFLHPYRAITQMAAQLQQSVTNMHNQPMETDELLYLRTVFSQLITQGNRLQREIDVYKPAMRLQLVSDMLRPGHIEFFPDHMQKMEAAGLPIHDRSFVVIALKSGEKGEVFSSDIVIPLITPLRSHELSPVCVDREDEGVVVLLTGSIPITEKTYMNFVHTLLNSLENEGIRSMAVGIGTVAPDFMGVPISYRAAQLALSHCLLLEGSGIYEYEQIIESHPQSIGLNSVNGEIGTVIDALNRTDAEGMHAALDALYGKMARLRFSPSMTKAISSQLIMRGMEITARFDANLATLIQEYPQGILYALDQIETLNEYRQFLEQIMSEMMNALEYRKNNVGSARLAQRIVSYLDANYTDTELCANMLAEIFSVTPAHISRVFKENTGTNLSVYLTKLRIERAKVLLLQERSLPLSAIAENVGYASVQTFMRAFKKETGIPPGSYKQEYLRLLREDAE